jgi:hypothetical protein
MNPKMAKTTPNRNAKKINVPTQNLQNFSALSDIFEPLK